MKYIYKKRLPISLKFSESLEDLPINVYEHYVQWRENYLCQLKPSAAPNTLLIHPLATQILLH